MAMLIVLTTTANEEEAGRLAHAIVESKLAACVQILPQVTSVYFWEGKIHSEHEHLLLIKTLQEKFDDLSEFIRENHSYEVPEIVAIDAEKVSESYLSWLRDVLSRGAETTAVVDGDSIKPPA
jgi:periplasmic divalent cation tolerance protein